LRGIEISVYAISIDPAAVGISVITGTRNSVRTVIHALTIVLMKFMR